MTLRRTLDITFKSQVTPGISLSCSCAHPYQLALATSAHPLPGTITTCISAENYDKSLVMKNRLFAYAKTKTQISCAITAQLISVFVFATWLVQSLFYLNPNFQASSHLLWLYRPVCVRPEDRFSHNEAHVIVTPSYPTFIMSCVATKICLRGFRPCPTQTGLYSHRRWLEA